MRIINATPHKVTAMTSNGELVHFEKSEVPSIRCNQVYGSWGETLEGCPVVMAGAYTVDLSTVDTEIYGMADVIIVSTIVAADAGRIREHLEAPWIRILVPDSGPTAKRDEKGQIEHVVKFLEY